MESAYVAVISSVLAIMQKNEHRILKKNVDE